MGGLGFDGQKHPVPGTSLELGKPLSAHGSPRRIIVDLTDVLAQIAEQRSLTGIPRVVMEFTEAAPEIASRYGIPLIFGYYDQVSRHFIELIAEKQDSPTAPENSFRFIYAKDNVALSKARSINFSKIRMKYEGKPLRQHFHLAKGHARLARRRFMSKIGFNLGANPQARMLKFRSNDVFLMLGSGWHALPVLEYIRPFVLKGLIHPLVLVHDLIPLLNTGERTIPPALFRHWLDLSTELTGHYLTYSGATKSDLLSYFDTLGIAPTVEVVPLVHELRSVCKTQLSYASRQLNGKRYALFVGPLHGRKNARRLLEAWRIVLSRLGPELTPVLAITDGSDADNIEPTHIRPIRSHVCLLDRPGDYELSVLYKHAAFTVFPSTYEGWGLPVGESLWHGTPCITSNISSLPEVGGSLCDYVDPFSIESISEGILRLASDEKYRIQRRQLILENKLRSWSDFAEGVLAFATRMQWGEDVNSGHRH